MSHPFGNGLIDNLQAQGNRGAEDAARHIIENAEQVKKLIAAVFGDHHRLKNAAIKTLQLVAGTAPEIVYTHASSFKKLLDSEDNILRWNSIFILCDLARIDDVGKLDTDTVDRIIDQLYCDVLITASNTASAIWKIALYKPEYRDKIKSHLIRVDEHERDVECKAILAGKVILSLDEFMETGDLDEATDAFIVRQLKSCSSTTRRKAETFLKKHSE